MRVTDKTFVDSNVILYLFTDDVRAAAAESLFEPEATISVQVLNEVANVLRRKTRLSWRETMQALELVRSLCRVEPMTVETHERGLRIAERYSLSVYDANIAASALLAGCNVLYSEDMQHGLNIERRLRIVNPFRAEAR
jgi:predicted nucleic acid-binding protein